jgi:RNA polymerase sigma-70 factor (ECF subfamily)
MTSSHNNAVSSGGGTSRSLLEHARHADAAAWERLVRLYAPLVASWLRRWDVAEQDVLDLLQDVFSAVAANLERFRKERPRDTFRGWLLTIARNKVRDHARRSAQEPNAAGGTDAFVRMQQLPERPGHSELSGTLSLDDEPCDDAEFSDVLLRALESIRGQFHERTWRAFWGMVVDGRSAADVAADLEMQPGAVRVSKSRVLLRLRRELGDIAD